MPKKIKDKKQRVKRTIKRITNNNKNRLSVQIVLGDSKKRSLRKRKKRDDRNEIPPMLPKQPSQPIPNFKPPPLFYQPSVFDILNQSKLDRMLNTSVTTISPVDEVRNKATKPVELETPVMKKSVQKKIETPNPLFDDDDEIENTRFIREPRKRKPTNKSLLTPENEKQFKQLVRKMKIEIAEREGMNVEDVKMPLVRKELGTKATRRDDLLYLLRKYYSFE